ncbi:MAG: hypothetical protein DWP98_12835 [Bacteroidetes bacterium]|nr:MAG: hypothetical protein DWP98_12835 [Bacteroidota bacterium]MBL1144873.1 hypothetical protein [Bacteroidota bacterium]NOG57667.1 hypothetical protein [Bacteroidota bacterium]
MIGISLSALNDSTSLIHTKFLFIESSNVELGIKGFGRVAVCKAIKSKTFVMKNILNQTAEDDFLGNGRSKVGHFFEDTYSDYFTSATCYFQPTRYTFNDSADLYIEDKEVVSAIFSIYQSDHSFFRSSIQSSLQPHDPRSAVHEYKRTQRT